MHVGLLRHIVRFCAFLMLVVGFARPVYAQAKPAPPPPQEPTTLIDRLKEPDQGGGFHLTKNFAIVFGGIKSGSGIALGPALSHKFDDGAYVQVKGVYSVKRFALLQARYDSRKFWNDRAIVTSRLRWQDAPKLKLYALGPDAPDIKVDWAEEKTEGSARIRLQLKPAVRAAAGFGVEKYETGGGRIDLADFGDTLTALGLLPVAPVPGLGIRPVYAHTFFSAALDSRTSPDYSRSGRLLEAGIHDYHDLSDGQPAFGRFEAAAQQLIPTFGDKGVIDVSAQTWLSVSDAESAVPFFMMPTLGGSNYLKAYPSYRFRDRHALFLKGEFRWAVHKMIDAAGFYELGTAASRVKRLRIGDGAEAVGAGIRVHTRTSSLVDLDFAHGRDGFKFTIGFNSGGS
jgi:hypothetical protein